MEDPKKPDVLIIEDSLESASALQRLLEGTKMFGGIHISASGEDGFEHILSSPPDIIFLDLRLPGEDGLQTLDKIKKIPGMLSVPVIVVTVSKDAHDMSDSYRKGGAFLIHKPVEKELLMEVLMHLKITGRLKKGPKPA